MSKELQEEAASIKVKQKRDFIMGPDNEIIMIGDDDEAPKMTMETYQKQIEEPKREDEQKLKMIPESIDEYMPDIMSQKQILIGTKLAKLVEGLHERRAKRREAREMRKMLKNLPVQCRGSYFKMLDLKSKTDSLTDQCGL